MVPDREMRKNFWIEFCSNSRKHIFSLEKRTKGPVSLKEISSRRNKTRAQLAIAVVSQCFEMCLNIRPGEQCFDPGFHDHSAQVWICHGQLVTVGTLLPHNTLSCNDWLVTRCSWICVAAMESLEPYNPCHSTHVRTSFTSMHDACEDLLVHDQLLQPRHDHC